MYEAFYGFHDTPFRLTPDPHYLFLSNKHQEALGHLLYGVSQGDGVIVITGEIGTGKTTLVRTLMREVEAEAAVAYIFNPALSALELVQAINAELGLPAASTSRRELVEGLNQFLLTQRALGRRGVVVVDEAQDLEPGVLEQLRLLSNLETEREKLLQIILVGQPELRGVLSRAELAQLNQRVTLRWHLGRLDELETAAYIRHRVRVAAGGREAVVFSQGAVRRVYRFSQGVPRLINLVCHRALLVGYTREERAIGRGTVRRAIEELTLHGGGRPRRSLGRLAWLGTAAVAGGLVFVVAVSRTEPVWQLFFPLPPASSVSPATLITSTEGNSQPLVDKAGEASQPIAQGPSGQTSSAAGVVPSVESSSGVEPSASAPVSAPTLSPAGMPAASLSEGSESKPVWQTDLSAHAGEAFLGDLQRLDLARSAIEATEGLLRAWGAEGLREEEKQGGVLDLGHIAQAHHLEYLPFSGNLNLLTLLDLPVIVELLTPEQKELRFVLLLKINGERCQVVLGEEQEVPLGVLTDNWFGRAHLFWRNFERLGVYLTMGSVGESVQRLHILLRRAEVYSEPPSMTFDKKTEEAVALFQRTKRLMSDGVVGPLTMIMLYNSVPGYAHPRLKGGDDPRLYGGEA